MRTRLRDQPERAAAILIQDEVFTEEAHALRPAVVHLRNGAERLPIAAQERPHPRTRLDLGKQLIFGRRQHGDLPGPT